IERQHLEHVSGPIDFGRGRERDGIPRCVLLDPSVSRDHVRIEEQSDGRIRVENLSQRVPIRVLTENSTIAPGQVVFLKPPVRLSVGGTLLDIETRFEAAELDSGCATLSPRPMLAKSRPREPVPTEPVEAIPVEEMPMAAAAEDDEEEAMAAEPP